MFKQSMLIILSAVLFFAGCGDSGTGAAGTAAQPEGYLITWKGSATVSPADPKAGWAYYDVNFNTAYIYDGESWKVLIQGGPQGSDGTTIIWKGTSAAPLSDPQLNWAYYNSTSGISYIWDGDSWEIIARDGSSGIDRTDYGLAGTGAATFTSISVDPSDSKPYLVFSDNDNGSKINLVKLK